MGMLRVLHRPCSSSKTTGVGNGDDLQEKGGRKRANRDAGRAEGRKEEKKRKLGRMGGEGANWTHLGFGKGHVLIVAETGLVC